MSVAVGRLLFGALLAALLPLSLGASGLTLSLPQELPEDRDFAGWERIEGRAEIGAQDISYILYVDPRYPALYRLTRYRITVVTRTAEGREMRSAEDEKLVWNSRPGIREPLRCYTLQASPEPGHWNTVPSGSEGYRNALSTAVSLYQHHHRQLKAAIP